MPEKLLSFESEGFALSGVLHLPESSPPAGGVVMVHGWTGSKLGPHRMFVKAARRLAEAGWASLRFDLRGRGDSQGKEEDADLASMVADTRAALSLLDVCCPSPRKVVLGICSGANVGVGVLSEVPGLEGLILWSMPTYGTQAQVQQGLLQTQSVLKKYLQKATRIETWKKAVSGRLQPKMIAKALFSPLKDKTGRGGVVDRVTEAELDRRFLRALRDYPGPILHVYGTADPMAGPGKKAFQEMARLRRGPTEFYDVPGANHSFYDLREETEVIQTTLVWMNRVWG